VFGPVLLPSGFKKYFEAAFFASGDMLVCFQLSLFGNSAILAITPSPCFNPIEPKGTQLDPRTGRWVAAWLNYLPLPNFCNTSNFCNT
jgi:hypothetical protein